MTMRPLDLYDAGYHELVSVIPPGADISPGSSIDPVNRGKAPGKKGTRGWYGYNFTGEAAPTRDEVSAYEKWGANLGIMARRFPAIDIDVNSPALAKFIRGRAEDAFGKAPARHSRDPRLLLMYRTEEPFSRMALAISYGEDTHLVEVLAGERQYLIGGTHPSGKPYRWEGQLPAPGDLPLITREGALAFLQDLSVELADKGLTCRLIGDGTDQKAEAPPQESLEAPTIDALRSLVGYLPNNYETAPTWEHWIEVGHAIKAAAAGDPEGLIIFLDWTARCERVSPADEAEAQAQYERMRAPHRVGWRYLQELADAHAPDYTSAQDDFGELADLAPGDVAAPKEADHPPIELTDEGVVAWIRHRVHNKVRFSPASKMWYVWNGHRWERDEMMAFQMVVRRHLKMMSGLLMDRAAVLDEDEGKHLRAAARAYQSATKIAAVVNLLQATLAVTPDQFDPDPLLLNTPGGVVDLKSGIMHESRPEEMHSRSTAVTPRKGSHPKWDAFLHDLTGGDEEFTEWLQRMLGYTLTGEMGERSLWYCWGSETGTGKSTIIRTIMALWGSYASPTSPDVLLRSTRDRIPAELARMPGVRLVTATEPEAGKQWDEQRVKSITGGDALEVRFLYGQPFTYHPQFKILIVGNEEPELRHIDAAMLRRIRIVPFNIPVPESKQNPHLVDEMVEEEGCAILDWMIQGCLKWQRTGLGPCTAVDTTTANYAADEDLLDQWIGEECVVEPTAEATNHDLYRAWTAWCGSRGENPGRFKQFRRRMRPAVTKYSLEDTRVGDRRLRGFMGLGLRPSIYDGTEFDT